VNFTPVDFLNISRADRYFRPEMALLSIGGRWCTMHIVLELVQDFPTLDFYEDFLF